MGYEVYTVMGKEGIATSPTTIYFDASTWRVHSSCCPLIVDKWYTVTSNTIPLTVEPSQ